ncbi:MAG: hypothetical protein IJ576_05980 [Synergistaceae bacterium]|nr:hypothetical protein [Synergistaceae bacterium]
MAVIASNNMTRELLGSIRQGLLRRYKSCGDDEKVIESNRLFRLVLENPELDPGDYAAEMSKRYKYNIGGGRVLGMFRDLVIASPEKRVKLCSWAEKVAELFIQCVISRKRSDFEKLVELKAEGKKIIYRRKMLYDILNRAVCLTLYTKCPELNINDDIEKLEKFGSVYAKYFWAEIEDLLEDYCVESDSEGVKKSAKSDININKAKDIKSENENIKAKEAKDDKDIDIKDDELALAYEQERRKVKQLSSALERANMAMEDLQTEFEERLEEEKAANLTEFFARLNSEKYGCILDELLNVHKGIRGLNKQGVELPVEISGLFILIVKLAQFVRDSHIEPIMKVNEIRKITAEDLLSCEYDGTPFKDNNDEKSVKVLSSGWVYKGENEIQIARPKLKEI